MLEIRIYYSHFPVHSSYILQPLVRMKDSSIPPHVLDFRIPAPSNPQAEPKSNFAHPQEGIESILQAPVEFRIFYTQSLQSQVESCNKVLLWEWLPKHSCPQRLKVSCHTMCNPFDTVPSVASED